MAGLRKRVYEILETGKPGDRLSRLADRHPRDTFAGKWARAAGVLFVAGIVVFSGSMYFYGLVGGVPLPGVTPAGGIALMAGWACLGLAAFRRG